MRISIRWETYQLIYQKGAGNSIQQLELTGCALYLLDEPLNLRR